MNYHIAAVITAFLIAGLVSVLVSIITANRIRDEDLIAARKITQKREQQVKEEKYRKIFFRTLIPIIREMKFFLTRRQEM